MKVNSTTRVINPNLRGKLRTVRLPAVMAILNATPDSFYSGSRLTSVQDALERAAEFVVQGADILDVGGASSRPGAEVLSPREEIERLEEIIRSLRQRFPQTLLSVDTFHPEVAGFALEYGADIINDISGGENPEMYNTVARHDAMYVLMHMRGTPSTMQDMTDYDLWSELGTYFTDRIHRCWRAGVRDIIIDPGFGFAKTLEQNYDILRNLEVLKSYGFPILIGLSRKSMVNKVLGTQADQALNGTTALHVLALERGADILRVHDVEEADQVRRLLEVFKG